MMGVGAVFWVVLGLWLERRTMDEKGVKKRRRLRNRQTSFQVQKLEDKLQPVGELVKNFETTYMSRDSYEQPPVDSHEECMIISGLKKKYDNGPEAVKGINLKLHRDQIFVLLGHNGAGKTSTISLLTGTLQPTEGQIEIFGINLLKEFESVRKFIGTCPQHDILFSLLTPREHLEIFHLFKGE